MTDQVHTNETPRGLLGFLGKIAGPNGFFGPGFWADFKEGWDSKKTLDQTKVDKKNLSSDEYEPNSAYDPKIHFDHYNPNVIYSFFNTHESTE